MQKKVFRTVYKSFTNIFTLIIEKFKHCEF